MKRAVRKDSSFFCAPQRGALLSAHGAEGYAACGRQGQRGHSLSQKRMAPFGYPKRKAFDWQSRARMTFAPPECRVPARGVAALGVAIRFDCAPTIRCCAAVGGSAALRMRHTPCGCRSADLVEVRSNSRLPPVSSMRRAQQCRIRHAVCRRGNVTRASR